jgi:hypothetical protein
VLLQNEENFVRHDQPPEIDENTTIEAGDCALIVKKNGEMRLYLPKSENEDELLTPQVAALVIIANKMLDPDWVEKILEEEIIEEVGN